MPPDLPHCGRDMCRSGGLKPVACPTWCTFLLVFRQGMFHAVGGYSHRMRAACYFCGRHTRDVLILTPSQFGPKGEHTLWPQQLYKHPFFPTKIAQPRAECKEGGQNMCKRWPANHGGTGNIQREITGAYFFSPTIDGCGTKCGAHGLQFDICGTKMEAHGTTFEARAPCQDITPACTRKRALTGARDGGTASENYAQGAGGCACQPLHKGRGVRAARSWARPVGQGASRRPSLWFVCRFPCRPRVSTIREVL